MRKFEEYLKVIFIHEGFKYTNHKDDSGGPTQLGISLKFLKMRSLDINNDGEINIKDIQEITVDKATELYHTYFWKPMNLEGIDNELLKLHLFDMGINAGTKTAIKILQEMLGATIDGVIGNQTIAKINSYGERIVADYANARKMYYNKIINNNPRLKVFRKGWYNRVDTTYFKK